jgi:hypothetical protein
MDNNNVEQPVQEPIQEPIQEPEAQPGKGTATASLILGIITLVCMFFGPFAWLGIISGIIGLILGIKSKKQAPSGMATAGIVMSAIGLGLCVLIFAACAICVGLFATTASNGIDTLENMNFNNINLNLNNFNLN